MHICLHLEKEDWYLVHAHARTSLQRAMHAGANADGDGRKSAPGSLRVLARINAAAAYGQDKTGAHTSSEAVSVRAQLSCCSPPASVHAQRERVTMS